MGSVGKTNTTLAQYQEVTYQPLSKETLLSRGYCCNNNCVNCPYKENTNVPEIVERELWDHYSELPNPSWYEYKENNMTNEIILHHCDVCNKEMTVYDLGYMGKPLTTKKNPKYSKGNSGIQILCHEHHDELLNTLGKNPNKL